MSLLKTAQQPTLQLLWTSPDENLRKCGRFNGVYIQRSGFDARVPAHLPDALPNLRVEAILDIIVRSTSNKHYLLGNSLAISLHLVPYILRKCISCKSYSSVQEDDWLLLSTWFNHLSLHCFPVLLTIS